MVNFLQNNLSSIIIHSYLLTFLLSGHISKMIKHFSIFQWLLIVDSNAREFLISTAYIMQHLISSVPG